MTDDPNLAYWKSLADKERKRADQNLRLAAERANEIAELRIQLKDAQAEVERLRADVNASIHAAADLTGAIVANLTETSQP